MKKKGKKSARTDKDNPVWTKADFKRARPLKEVDPALFAMLGKRRGRPPVQFPKKQITMRLSSKIVDEIKASGAGYNARIERILEEALDKGRL